MENLKLYNQIIRFIEKGKNNERSIGEIKKKFNITTSPHFLNIITAMTYMCLLYESDNGKIIGILKK